MHSVRSGTTLSCIFDGTNANMFVFVCIQHDQIILVICIEVSFNVCRRAYDIYYLTSKHFWIFWILHLINYHHSIIFFKQYTKILFLRNTWNYSDTECILQSCIFGE